MHPGLRGRRGLFIAGERVPDGIMVRRLEGGEPVDLRTILLDDTGEGSSRATVLCMGSFT